MKHYLYICVSVLLLAGATPIQAQNTKATSGKAAESATQAEPRNLLERKRMRTFAQNLGGTTIHDYLDGQGFFTDAPKKKDSKFDENLAKFTYKSYEEAYKNLPGMPNINDIDTREKMSDYKRSFINPHIEAIKLHEPHDAFDAGVKKRNAEMMENAKRAHKGLPYDSVMHFDPKAKQYKAILDKITPIYQKEYKEATTIRSAFEEPDPDVKQWLFEYHGAARTVLHKDLSPLIKQFANEWFKSSACQRVQAIEDQLVSRARVENPKKTPQWFIDGRKQEGEIVAEYNRQLLKRWMAKLSPKLPQKKAPMLQLINLNSQVDALHAQDAPNASFTSEYTNTKNVAVSTLEQFFYSYFEILDLVTYCPLVRTPPTLEGKKFKL